MKMKLEARLERWPELANALESWGETVSLSASMQQKVRLLAEEWFLNIVYHGSTSSEELMTLSPLVEVEASVVDVEHHVWQTIELSFTDNGKPFNPLQYPLPTLQPDIERTDYGGLGIYLIRQLCSYCHYERTDLYNRLFMQVRNECISS